MVRLLHTSDIHLGRQFPMLRSKASEYRNQLLKTFEKIVRLAGTEGVSLLLIAGDLFDTNRIYGLTVGKVLSEFKELDTAGIRVCIIPGTHDAYDKDSVYRSLSFPPNVTVLTPEHNIQTYEDLGLTVYGMVPETRYWENSPLEHLPLVQESTFHVGMIHCSINIAGRMQNDTGTLDRNAIGSSGLDYLALGHWHSFQDFSQGRTAACYSGSPEPIDMDQTGAGNVVMVTLKENEKAEFQPIFVGTKKSDTVTIDVSPFESIEPLSRIIESRADPNLILEATLTGLCKINYTLNAREIEDMLGGRFFNLRVINETHPALATVKLNHYTDKTVTGRYLRIIEEKIATAGSPEDKSLYEEALKLGFALLQGQLQVIE